MTIKDDDKESQMLKEMFEEIMRMINNKQIKIESIMQEMAEHDKMTQDMFVRIYKTLTEHGKKKQWL